MDSFTGDGEVLQIDFIEMNRLHQGAATSFLGSFRAERREDPVDEAARDSLRLKVYAENRACTNSLEQ